MFNKTSKMSLLNFLTTTTKTPNYLKSFHRLYNNNPSGNITVARQGLSNLKKGSLKNLCNFNGRMVMLGFGAIGEGTLPLILRHINVPNENILIVTAPDRAKEAQKAAQRFGISCEILTITQDNYKEFLKKTFKKGDFCLNLSVDVSSLDLIEYCNNNNILYLDTVTEPWKGGYYDTSLSMSERSNYNLREKLLKLKSKLSPTSATAVACHGANPGMVSHLVKQAMLNIANDIGVGNNNNNKEPKSKQEWAKLAYDLGIKVIHVAERDAQIIHDKPKQRDEFVNTWSVEGFISEGCQPSELGWGTHEKELPPDGEGHTYGNKNAIYIKQPSFVTKVRSWTPNEGPYFGWLITHTESITLSDYLTYYDEKTKKPIYRPTCHYAYHPSDQAALSINEYVSKGFVLQNNIRIVNGEKADCLTGIDELGVLLCGHAKNAYWFGSQLDVKDVKETIECNQATSLQVTSGALSGVVWAIKNPQRGVVECEELDYKFILDIITPYISPIVGVYTDWKPTENRGHLFPDPIDTTDPWQFYNTRVREMWQQQSKQPITK